MILIDNYDSFTYNIVHYFKEMGVNPRVFTRNEIDVKAFADIDFDRIVLSPGPGHPIEADLCLDLIHRYHPTKKILGICLGHQCIAHAFGASIGKDQCPTHGKTSAVYHTGTSLFKGIPQGFSACRYHSLIVDRHTLHPPLEITAQTQTGIVMGIQHRYYPIFGLQFHPEAILTEYGKVLLRNFLDF